MISMKKAILLTALFALSVAMMKDINIEQRHALVTAVNGDIVTVECGGHYFDVYADGYKRYDNVTITVDNKGTDDYFIDDEIINICHGWN